MKLLTILLLVIAVNAKTQTTAIRLTSLERRVSSLESKLINADSLQRAGKAYTDSLVAVLRTQIASGGTSTAPRPAVSIDTVAFTAAAIKAGRAIFVNSWDLKLFKDTLALKKTAQDSAILQVTAGIVQVEKNRLQDFQNQSLTNNAVADKIKNLQTILDLFKAALNQ